MSQTQQIRQHLANNGSITAMEALRKYGCFRLAARIRDLRAAGMRIQTHLVKTRGGKSVAMYVAA